MSATISIAGQFARLGVLDPVTIVTIAKTEEGFRYRTRLAFDGGITVLGFGMTPEESDSAAIWNAVEKYGFTCMPEDFHLLRIG